MVIIEWSHSNNHYAQSQSSLVCRGAAWTKKKEAVCLVHMQ